MYAVIHPGRLEPEICDGAPTVQQIAEVVGGSPLPLRCRRNPGVTLWVNDDFVSLDLERNPLATIVAVQVGGARQPYAGPVVLTGVVSEFDPGDIPAHEMLSIESFLFSARVIAGLAEGEPDQPASAEVREAVRTVAHYAMTAPFPAAEAFSLSVTGPEDLAAQIEFLQHGILPPGAERLR